MKAFVHATGRIEIASKRPDLHCVLIAEAPAKLLREALMRRSRLAHDNSTMLVPGVPEADTAAEKIEAVAAFAVKIATLIERLKTS